MWKYSLFIYSFAFVKNFTQKKKVCHDMCIWIFPITLSHFGGIAWFFYFCVWWVPQLFFEKVNLYLVLYIINWWQSHLGLSVWFGSDGGKKKWSKNECEFFYNQIRMKSSHLVSRAQNPFGASILYNDSQTQYPTNNKSLGPHDLRKFTRKF
jgi:hypothetical protein